MALFGRKKEKKEEGKMVIKPKAIISAPAKASPQTSSSELRTSIIIRPRITEKSGILSQSGEYTFEVARNANKNSIATAVAALYKVTPTKVAIINLPEKNIFRRGRWGRVTGVRKAIVTVKKGEKIDFV